jgi:hypothetical protein
MSWPRVVMLAVVFAAVGVGAWEAYWRVAQQYEASYRNSDGQWAEARRRVDRSEPNATVFIGSSRTQFDIDLDVWQEETGVHAVQLALEGSNAIPILTHIADDEDFSGLLVVGITPPLVFFPGIGLRADAVQHYFDETPSQWLGNKLSYPLETRLAFYNIDTKLFTVLTRQAWWPDRPGLPFQQPEVRKIGGAEDREHATGSAGEYVGPGRGRSGVQRHRHGDLADDPREPATTPATGGCSGRIRSAARAGGGGRRQDPFERGRGRLHPAAVQRLVP